MTFSLRVKLSVLIIIILTVVFGAVGLLISWHESRLIHDKIRIESETLSSTLVASIKNIMLSKAGTKGHERMMSQHEQLKNEMYERLQDLIKEVGQSKRPGHLLKRVQLFDRSGDLKIQRGIPSKGAVPIQLGKVIATGKGMAFYEKTAGAQLHTHLEPLPNEKPCQSCHGADHKVRGVVGISFSISEGMSDVKQNQIYLGILALFFALITILIMRISTKRLIIEPIFKLASAMKEIESGNLESLEKQINIKSGDEIGDIARVFNSMTKSLKESQEAQRQTYLELKESEERLRSVFQLAIDAIILADDSGKIISWNQGSQAIFGYSEAEMLGQPLAILIPERYRDDHRRGLERLRKTGESKLIGKMVERYGLRKDGSEFPVEISLSAWKTKEGMLCYVGIVRDITDRKRAEEERARLASFPEKSPNPIIEMDDTGAITYLNPAACQQFPELLTSGLQHPILQTLKSAADTLQKEQKQFLILDTMLRNRAYEQHITSLPESNLIRSYIVDITERRWSEKALEESKERLQNIFSSSNDAIFVIDPAWDQILDVNPKACHMLGYSREELLSTPISAVHPNEMSKLLGFVQSVFEDRHSWTNELTCLTKTGQIIPAEISASAADIDDRACIIALVRDITERKRTEEIIRNLAYYDSLTTLPNRMLFIDRLNMALAQAKRNNQRFAVFFIDLDQFKLVNDTLGHEMGNQFLKDVAERLTSLLREGDTVARFGGDEFVLLLPGINQEEGATKIAQRIMETFKQPWVLDGKEFHITASLGIAIYPNDGEDAETLLRNADIAMYRAKEGGRNNYQFYTSAMSAKILERLELENSLRRALEHHEFVLHYQPRVNVNTAQIVGVEALIRWQHPDRGLISPAEFIPIAEESGLIVPIEEWVLHTACSQNKTWQKSGFPTICVSVNISSRHFQQQNLPEKIDSVLKETGLDGHWLDLEITEGTAMEDVEHTIKMLCKLKEMGIRIEIDDFGVGYSSLNYLKRLPIDALKIDRSFVKDINIDLTDLAIVITIINLAKNLKLKVIAEGVETKEQLVFLKEQGCDEIQGYLFSKPVPVEGLEKMLRSSKTKS